VKLHFCEITILAGRLVFRKYTHYGLRICPGERETVGILYNMIFHALEHLATCREASFRLMDEAEIIRVLHITSYYNDTSWPGLGEMRTHLLKILFIFRGSLRVYATREKWTIIALLLRAI
jgi:hypothetical protein